MLRKQRPLRASRAVRKVAPAGPWSVGFPWPRARHWRKPWRQLESVAALGVGLRRGPRVLPILKSDRSDPETPEPLRNHFLETLLDALISPRLSVGVPRAAGPPGGTQRPPARSQPRTQVAAGAPSGQTLRHCPCAHLLLSLAPARVAARPGHVPPSFAQATPGEATTECWHLPPSRRAENLPRHHAPALLCRRLFAQQTPSSHT